jgi:two-component system LytT family response regulator
MKTRTLIVDDEPLARQHLTSLLSLEPDFEIAGECGEGEAAIEAIWKLRPDLVFLDVQMPRVSGFEVLEALDIEHSPAVIFVTAFDQFAVRAFDAQALDYLLKPFRRDRFQAALNRVRRGTLQNRGSGSGPDPCEPAADRMIVKSGDRLVFVPLEELEYIRASANYVRLHFGARTCEVRETITMMEARLSPRRFVRIHRSYIVNLAAVLEIYPCGGGEYMLSLRSGRQLPVGPSYPAAIREALFQARLPRFGGGGAI